MAPGEIITNRQVISGTDWRLSKVGRVRLITANLEAMLSQYESAGGDLTAVQLTISEWADMGGAQIDLHGYPLRHAPKPRRRGGLRLVGGRDDSDH